MTKANKALNSILSGLESEIFATMQKIEEVFGISSDDAVEIVRDFLKEKF